MNIEDDILIVDDEIPNLRLLTELLEKEGYQVRPAEKAQTALDSALAKPPGLILLDVRMPEMDGFELCRRLKQDKRTQHVPIIFVSALQDIEARLQGFEAGGVDFISKPFQELEILARVRTHMNLHRMQKHLEQLVDERTSELSESRASLEQKVRALKESDERYELAVTGSAAGIWDWDIRFDKVYYSNRLKELLGYAPDEFLDTQDEIWNRMHPDDYEAARMAMDKHLKEHVPYIIDYRLQTKSGEYRWFHARGQALWDETGKAIRMSGSLIDINERKQAEKELQRSEYDKSLILNSTGEIIAFHDLDHNFQWVNKAYLETTGLSLSEVIGKKCYHVWGLDRLCTDCPVAKAIETGEPHDAELTPQNQEHWPPDQGSWMVRAAPVRDDDGSVVGAIEVTSDITERKEAELNYRTVADFTYDWEYWANMDGTLNYVSPSSERVSGYGAQDFMDNPSLFREIIVPQDREMWDSHSCDARQELKPQRIQFRIHRRDGEIRWIEHACQPVSDNTGRSMGFRASNRDITDRKQAEIELRQAYAEIEQLKNQLEAESAYLQDEIKLEHNFKNIIGQSESLKYVLHRVEQVAPTDSPVLILGETGTGKELVARAIHDLSPRRKRAMVKVNCAALPGELIESELFGREKGAFTGATTAQSGRFELANGSTLFLDEIGELPFELQAKLLRVLESGEFERLGSSRTLHSDARIIAATNRVLEEEVRKGRFREDLWYRLKVFPITVPPLREHPEDIPLLVRWFLDQLTRKTGKHAAEIPKRTMQMLQGYPWPGNVRELKHAVEAAVITAQGKKLNFELPQIADTSFSDFKSFREMERDYILRVLKAKNWKIGGKNSAASTLGMHVNTLRGRMKKLGIKRPKS